MRNAESQVGMVANRAIKLASALLILTGSFFASSTVAFAEDSGPVITAASNNSQKSENQNGTPASTEPSEASKQAAEKAREAAKQAAEKAREAAKQAAEKVREAAKKSSSSKGESKSGQLQLPPLIIRPAEPGDKVSGDAEGDANASSSSGSNSTTSTPAASPSASADPNAITNGAGTGTKKFYKKPSTTQNVAAATDGSTGANQATSTQSNSNTSTNVADNQDSYVVAPIGDAGNSATGSAPSNFLKSANPTANDPIRVVAAATSKTPADQFFEAAGYGIAALGGGVALLMGWGVYRGIRARRSEGFDFEYRS